MGLKDDLNKMDLSVAEPRVGDRPRRQHGSGALPAPTALMQGMAGLDDLKARAAKASELEAELTEARRDLTQWEGAKATQALDPKLISRSRWANRDARHFESPDFKALKDEIASAGGNVQPIKVRPLTGDNRRSDSQFEIVYGHRRHQACLELGLPVLALVDTLDDKSLFVEMDRENRSRTDLSAWEQGVMYKRALDQGLFPSNRRLAEAVGAHLTNVGRALALASLPTQVVEAFASPLDLQFRWAAPLKDAMSADSERVLSRARAIKNEGAQLPAAQVFARLTSVDGGDDRHAASSIEVKVNGKRVATVQAGQNGSGVVKFEPGTLSTDRLKALSDVIERFLAGSKRTKPT
jgi:ParB family chromosome partitioning protein